MELIFFLFLFFVMFCFVLFFFFSRMARNLKMNYPAIQYTTSAPFQDYKQGLSSQSILTNLACRCLRILVDVVVHAIVILLLNFRSHSVWTTLSFPEQFDLFRTFYLMALLGPRGREVIDICKIV